MTPLNASYYDTFTQNTPFYYDAFRNQEQPIWENTPFKSELENICYSRCLACWTRGGEEADEDRRLLLRSYLKPQFGTEETDDILNTMFSILPSDNSYVMRTLKNLCYVYNTPPQREFNITGAKLEKLIELLTETKYNKTLQIAYRLAKLCNEVAIRPVRRSGKLQFEILTPDLYRVEKDSFQNINAVWIPYVEKNKQYFHVWQNDTYFVANEKGDFIHFAYNNGKKTIQGTPLGIPNIYGQIPYTFLRLSDNYTYSSNLFELVKAQLYSNKLDLMTDENVTFNGFSVWVATNIDKVGTQKIRLSPRHIFDVRSVVNNDQDPTPPSLQTVTPSPQFDLIHTYKIEKMKSILKNIGLPVSMIDETTGSVTGIGILRERQELTDAQEEDKDLLIAFENELINSLANHYNIESGINHFAEIQVNLNFADVKVLEEPSVMFETEKTKFEYGLMRPTEFLSKFSDMTFENEEDAIKFMQENKEYLKLIRGQDEPTDEPTNNEFADNGSDEQPTSAIPTEEVNGYNPNRE